MVEDILREGKVEEITPDRMAAINREMERRAVENEWANGKNLINRYTCEECGHETVTVDLHVGTTPYLMRCGRSGCGGTAASAFYRPQKHLKQYDGEIHFEWFRPLTEEECSVYQRDTWEDAEKADFSGYDEEERARYREIIAEERARYVLIGGLARRPWGATADPSQGFGDPR